MHCWGDSGKGQCEMPKGFNEQFNDNIIEDYIDNNYKNNKDKDVDYDQNII